MSAASFRAKRLARRVVDTASRTYMAPTSMLRDLPDFLIIGAQRCGTTSLYRYLEQHPNVLPAVLKHKGIHFFDTNYPRGLAWYRSHFPTRAARALRSRRLGSPVITGEGSPYYVFHPLGAERIAKDLPGARFVLMLRDPVARAYSHYQHEVARGFERLSFEDALEQEEDRLSGEVERVVADPAYPGFALQHHSYIARGRYLEQIRRWHALVPPEHLLIVDSAEFFARPEEGFRRVLRFLGLSEVSLPSYRKLNAHAYGGIPARAQRILVERFDGANRELYDYLGRSFDWGSPNET